MDLVADPRDACPREPVRLRLARRRVLGELQQRPIGLVADRVFEVTGLDDDRLDPAPETGCRWQSDHIAGIGRRGDKFVVVLNLENLLADDATTFVTPSNQLAA